MSDIVERLLVPCRDWDGSEMADAAETLSTMDCGTMRDAAETIKALRAAIRAFLPKNVALDNPNTPDDLVIPLDTTMGELRSLAALSTTEAK